MIQSVEVRKPEESSLWTLKISKRLLKTLDCHNGKQTKRDNQISTTTDQLKIYLLLFLGIITTHSK